MIIAVMALVFNTVLFSCTTDEITETGELYHVQATEGDDGQVEMEREDDE
ncbi:hypothetical protein NBT05_03485 [Aquimarina sp. ERC-38]|nr:hypothetical protein [Aquimarina sp. ERC-38]UZO81543.1 hypothetical protein NBT05_03485 [Aquimarina sp. ERC-38]